MLWVGTNMAKKYVARFASSCSRRNFLETIALGAAGGLVLSACLNNGANLPSATTTACGTSTCIDLTDTANAALAQTGGSMVLDSSGDTIIVVRVSDTQVIALSAVCTHAGCLVDYNASAQRLDCNCHGSEFGEDGRVLRGPASRPLRVYQASLANNLITIAV
jgi:cytochrome b6-f complex iron-sulfur subunit